MEDGQFHTSFSKETWATFKAHLRPGPIQMLNLIRLRARAEYPDGRASTGAEAYRIYSDLSAPVFQALDGKIIWRGGHELTMVGPQSETWDIAFIAEYPSVQVFLDMMRNETYRDAMKHRQAGVLDSRLVRFASRENGLSFAD
ncbi:DUF1330 domain-containing protein [Roseobacter sp. MH60115]|uniref:DUF1330 domain-containing protein n=1 Tax=Roseobacter sp. MH60115 TaxID=2785324 RepID=UPI0018A2D1A1|nr:DUF1330 domain-containing protein [Roseobacter sp. MH60115]